ncbi:MAG: DNA mismatch repair protein MutS, partial [Cyanobacteriota bacterium]|nr:DNA mismatch repair protein MutS [Cyanobacteriota bacterium]
MPRSADPQPELALQGSLFGEPEPHQPPAAPELSTGDLSDADLGADAAARPRQRKAQPDQADQEQTDPDEDNPSEDDQPAWAHHSQVDPQQLTPMLRHYVELKRAHPERVLLYRLGDFFECFFEDAITLSRVLELTLTGKEGGKAIGRVPMAGIPHHAAERYCADLIRRGFSVALCDQLESTPAKGALLKRDITRVLTPGTVLEEGMLSARRNNWLAAVVVEPANGQQPLRWGLASADVSTGEVQVMQRSDSDALHQQLAQLGASELLWSGDGTTPLWCPDQLRLTPVASTPFSRPEAEAALLHHYKLASLDGLGLPELPLALRA